VVRARRRARARRNNEYQSEWRGVRKYREDEGAGVNGEKEREREEG
jgi:hypothetical protein